MIKPIVLLAALAMPAAAFAQATTPMIPAGTYAVESHHTQAVFAVNHMGFSEFYGTIPNATGTLVIDPANLAATRLDVALPVAAIATTNAVLDGELKDPSWLDAAKYPEIRFVSTRLVQTGAHTARVEGMLTLHGVSRPVTLEASFNGAGVNPLDKAFTIGFSASGTIHRSEFGVTKYVPLIGDEVKLTLTAAFEKQG